MTLCTAAATDPVAQAAAEEALAGGANGIAALLTGFFAVAGAHPAVLLAPSAALVTGVGTGTRCFDGRSLQPGLDAPRPRGFQADEPLPAASYVAASRTPAMCALLHAHGSNRPLGALVRPGVRLATKRGATVRAELLQALGRTGPSLLRSGELARALLRVGGRHQGGLLTEADLLAMMPADEPPHEEAWGELQAMRLAWHGATPAPGSDRSGAQAIAVADTLGLVAVLGYSPDAGGVSVADGALLAPRDAVPVRRGVSRVTPGTPLAARLHLALLNDPASGWYAALGGAVVADGQLPVSADEALLPRLHEASKATGEAAIAVTLQRRKATTFAVRTG